MFKLGPPFQRVWAYPAKPAKVQLTKIWFGLSRPSQAQQPAAKLTAKFIYNQTDVVTRLNASRKRWPLVYSLLRRTVAIGEIIGGFIKDEYCS
jgi:hypothetical protein